MSPACDPRSVLIRAPVAPLNRYTAPALDPPASSNGDVTTTFPVLSGTTESPNRFPSCGFGSTNSANAVSSVRCSSAAVIANVHCLRRFTGRCTERHFPTTQLRTVCMNITIIRNKGAGGSLRESSDSAADHHAANQDTCRETQQPLTSIRSVSSVMQMERISHA